jgi:hypothetical protein
VPSKATPTGTPRSLARDAAAADEARGNEVQVQLQTELGFEPRWPTANPPSRREGRDDDDPARAQ